MDNPAIGGHFGPDVLPIVGGSDLKRYVLPRREIWLIIGAPRDTRSPAGRRTQFHGKGRGTGNIQLRTSDERALPGGFARSDVQGIVFHGGRAVANDPALQGSIDSRRALRRASCWRGSGLAIQVEVELLLPRGRHLLCFQTRRV